MAIPVLQYFSAAPPDASEAGIEAARAGQVRVGIRIYCVTAAAIAVLRVLWSYGHRGAAAHVMAGGLEIAGLCVMFFLAAPSRRMDARGWARTGTAMVLGVAAAWMVAKRVDGGWGSGVGGLLGQHLLASLLLPWTWREALVAGIALALANFGFVGLDLSLARAGWGTVILAVIFSPVMIGPGVGVNWYRHSRFRRRHVMRTESRLYQNLAREMEGARTLHEASLPRAYACGELRVHYDYAPHRHIGGDLLFVHPRIPREGCAVTLIVLDVAGHGIAAALTVNRVLGEIERLIAERERAGGELRPAELARGLNRYVRLTLANHGLYATAFIARVEENGTRVAWVNCGHPTAFVVGAPTAGADRSLRRLGSEAVMLGVVGEDEMDAAEQVEDLHPGCVLLACTDGATEARHEDGPMLMTEGFEKLLAGVAASVEDVERWPAEIARGVTSHRRGLSEDDTLLVAVERIATTPVARVGEAA